MFTFSPIVSYYKMQGWWFHYILIQCAYLSRCAEDKRILEKDSGLSQT